jgi:chromosome segregation ATPase
LSELDREKQQAERQIKTLTRDIERQRVTLNEKQLAKGALQAEINGKKSELAAKQAQKLAQETQLHAVEDQQLTNKQEIKKVERQMNDTARQIQQQTTLQQETKRLCDQAEAQLRNTERDLDRLTRQLNEKQNTHDKKKRIADNLIAQAEQRRTSQVAVDQELSQLSSTLQTRRAKINRKQRDIYTTSQHIQAQQSRRESQTNSVTDSRSCFEECDNEEDEQLVFDTQKRYA